MKQPKKWHEIYPNGTKDGEEEAKVFRCLSRNPSFAWVSTAAIVRNTNLSYERVEEIIDKYASKTNPPLIYAHQSNDDHWAYWERIPDFIKKDDRDLSTKDKDITIKNQITRSDIIENNLAKSQTTNIFSTNQCVYTSQSICDVENNSFNFKISIVEEKNEAFTIDFNI